MNCKKCQKEFSEDLFSEQISQKTGKPYIGYRCDCNAMNFPPNPEFSGDSSYLPRTTQESVSKADLDAIMTILNRVDQATQAILASLGEKPTKTEENSDVIPF